MRTLRAVPPRVTPTMQPADLAAILDGAERLLAYAERRRFVPVPHAAVFRTRIRALALRVETLAEQLHADGLRVPAVDLQRSA